MTDPPTPHPTRLGCLGWAVLSAGYAFLLVDANALLALRRASTHGAVAEDRKHGLTYTINNHGVVRWVTPGDFARFEQRVMFGFGGFLVCVLLLLLVGRDPARRRGLDAALNRRIWLLPLIVLILSYWI